VKPQPRSQPAGTFGYRRLAPSTFLASFPQSFELRTSMQFRWLPVSSGYSPPDSSPPATTRVVAVCSPVCIFDLSNRSRSNFRCMRPALVRLNSRPRLASEPALRPAPLRRNCGPNRLFQALGSPRGDLSFETQARAIQDISRSRVREFTLFRNTSKGNTRRFCGFPV
jgi:hypothetical protein